MKGLLLLCLIATSGMALAAPDYPALSAGQRQRDSLREAQQRERLADAQQLYLAETELDGNTWYRLRLGFFATATLVEGVLIVVGGVVGYKAMTALEETIRTHKQTRRAEPT